MASVSARLLLSVTNQTPCTDEHFQAHKRTLSNQRQLALSNKPHSSDLLPMVEHQDEYIAASPGFQTESVSSPKTHVSNKTENMKYEYMCSRKYSFDRSGER